MFIVTYGKQPRRNRYGYYLPTKFQPPTYRREFEHYNDAFQFFTELVREHKKWVIEFLDTRGPIDEDSTLWLVCANENGSILFNDEYIKSLEVSDTIEKIDECVYNYGYIEADGILTPTK